MNNPQSVSADRRGWLLIPILVFVVMVIVAVKGESELLGALQDDMRYFEVTTAVLQGHAIQLVMKWEGAEDLGRIVDLTIRTDQVTESCPSIACQKLGIDAERGMFSLPERIQYVEEARGCEFYPGCSYQVMFRYEDSGGMIQRNVTIPDCVDNICRCDYENKFPDFSALLTYNESAETMHLQWSIDRATDQLDESELRGFVVSYYKVHNGRASEYDLKPHVVYVNESNAGGVWTGVEDLPLPREYFGNEEDDGVLDKLKVEIFLHDSRECQGDSTIKYLELSRPKEDKATNSVQDSHWIPTSLIIVIVATFLVLIMVYIYKRSRLGQHIMAKVFRLPINYSNINIQANNSMTRTSFALQENQIYVEKELYEAKLSGAVDHYEVSLNSLAMGPEIGKGTFGRVFKAELHNFDGRGISITVAVKKLKKHPTEEEAEDFFNEIRTMKRVGYHENIISLLGCCTLRQPVLMVMEYVGKGDLRKYLMAIRDHQFGGSGQKHGAGGNTETLETESATESECSTDSDASYILQIDKPLRPSVTETLYTTVSSQNSIGGGDNNNNNNNNNSDNKRYPEHVLDHRELQQFAIQIANGMAHLEDLEITHRDLAARNILIDDQKRLKISDFGLSRDGVYVTTKRKMVPLRWLSVEAIRRSLYSSKSDVWAFGVVLWEIGTLGMFPYEGMDNHGLLPFLMDGGRLKKPDNCSDKLYDVMLTCWRENPLERPSFQRLMEILQEPEQKIYIDLDEMADNDDDVFYKANDK